MDERGRPARPAAGRPRTLPRAARLQRVPRPVAAPRRHRRDTLPERAGAGVEPVVARRRARGRPGRARRRPAVPGRLLPDRPAPAVGPPAAAAAARRRGAARPPRPVPRQRGGQPARDAGRPPGAGVDSAQPGDRHVRRLQRQAAVRLLRVGHQQGGRGRQRGPAVRTGAAGRVGSAVRRRRPPGELLDRRAVHDEELRPAPRPVRRARQGARDDHQRTDPHRAQRRAAARPADRALRLARRRHRRDLRQAAQRPVRPRRRQPAPPGHGQGRPRRPAPGVRGVHADAGQRPRARRRGPAVRRAAASTA